MQGKSVDRSRTEFRIRTEMVKAFKDNFRSKYRTLDSEDSDPGLLCNDCNTTPGERDNQAHCLRCPAWRELRKDLDLTFMKDVVTYFQRVLKARTEKEEEERKKRRIEREEEQKRRKEQGVRPEKRGRG